MNYSNNSDDDQKQIAELINFTVESAAAQLESTNNDLINLNSSSLEYFNLNRLELLAEKNEEEQVIPIEEDEIVNDEQLEAIAVSTITEYESDDTETMKNELKILKNRLDQFNDVKQTIRSMNDLIKEEIFNDFGSIIMLMRDKVDELTNQIKEKLKDAYSVVRDRQEKLVNRINELQFQTSSKKLTQDQIDAIYDELKLICDSSSTSSITVAAAAGGTTTTTSISNTSNNCSLFIDNNLYPQFNYFIDVSKLIQDINNLSIYISNQIPTGLDLNNNTNFDEFIIEQQVYLCQVTSRLNTDGSFWLKLISKQQQHQSQSNTSINNSKKSLDQTNVFIDELSKQIRRKRISDKTWLTYAEANRRPQINEKCFCLDTTSRKWLRAQIIDQDQIRLLDTGNQLDLKSFRNDDLLIWNDDCNDLMCMQATRAIKCYLANFSEDICLETKFFFKDTLANRVDLKCRLISKLNDNNLNEWIIDLFTNDNASINELIIDYNRNEKQSLNKKSAFNSKDIRVESGQLIETTTHIIKNNNNNNSSTNNVITSISASSLMDSQSSSTTTTNTDVIKPLSSDVDYSDIEDQIDAKRAYKHKEGICIVAKHIDPDGLFWIKPILDEKSSLFNDFKHISQNIGDFIMKTKWKSFGSLNMEPEAWRKCFIAYKYESGRIEWYRGQIERVYIKTKICLVRTLDHGYTREVSYHEIYPHRRFQDKKLEYLAIRCCLLPKGYNISLRSDCVHYFKRLLTLEISFKFNLIEQIQMNSKRLCWYTELIDQHGKIVNYELVQFAMNNETAPPIILDRFKLIQLVRDKCKVYYSKSEQQSICSIATTTTTTPTTTIQPAISLPTEHVHRTKHKQKAKNNLNKKNGLNQPLRCKSKSFDQILTNNTDNNVTNNNYNTANTNEKYHTIASGAGIAASAAVLVQAVNESNKFRHPNNSYHNSYNNNNNNNSHYKFNHNNNSNSLPSNNFATKKNNTKSFLSTCKTDAKYHNLNNKDDDKDDDDDENKKINWNKMMNNKKPYSYNQNRKSSGGGTEQKRPQKDQNQQQQQQQHELDYYNIENNSLFINGNSSIFNDVFIPSTEQLQMIRKSSTKRSQSWSQGLNIIEIERKRSEQNDEKESSINNYNANNKDDYTLNKVINISQCLKDISIEYKDIVDHQTPHNDMQSIPPQSFPSPPLPSYNYENNNDHESLQNYNNHDNTQAIPFRHMYVSPLLSTDSSQKYINDQEELLNGTNNRLFNKQRSHSEENYKYILDTLTTPNNNNNNNNNNNTNKLYVSSTSTSSSRSGSSSNKTTPNRNKSSKKETDDADESYASCAEEVDYNNDYLIRNSSPNTLIAPNLPVSLPDELPPPPPPPPAPPQISITNEANTLIVENYIPNSNKEAQTDENSILLNSKIERLKKFTIAVFVDSFDDYSLNRSSSSGSISLLDDQHQQQQQQRKSGENLSSLREFELNEEASVNLATSMTPAKLDQDVFIFESNPNNYDNLIRTNITSKPPIVPNSQYQFFSTSQNIISTNNVNNYGGLSTITECSNETFETCSNQSSEISADDKNVTLRKKALSNDKIAQVVLLADNNNQHQHTDPISLISSNSSSSSSSNSETLMTTIQQNKLNTKQLNETIVSEGGCESMSLGSYKSLNNIKNKLNPYDDVDLDDEVFLKQSLKSQQSPGLSKQLNKLINNNNMKNMNITTTTLEISSLTDSLYNSNNVVTPMYTTSDTASPFNPTSILNQSPNINKNINNNIKQRQSVLLPSPPPPLPPAQLSPVQVSLCNTMTSPKFPSPPQLTTFQSSTIYSNPADNNNINNISSPTLPPPPPAPPAEFFNEKPLAQITTNTTKNNQNKKALSLIEQITARLNLASISRVSNNSNNNNNNTSFDSKKSPSTPLLLNRSYTNNMISPVKNKKISQTNQIENNNDNNISNNNNNNNNNNKETANVSLYGLDVDDDNNNFTNISFKFPAPPPAPPIVIEDLSSISPSPLFQKNFNNNKFNKIINQPFVNKSNNSYFNKMRNDLNNKSCPVISVTNHDKPTEILNNTSSPGSSSSSSGGSNSSINSSSSNLSMEEQNSDPYEAESFLNRADDEKSFELDAVPRSFKLDHLIDINPKRLYEDCKFKAKIHDIIDENGHFWLEVIYSKEDEKKFEQIFRLFRLCSKISEPPKNIYVHKFLSAFYKDNWYRAIVIEMPKQQTSSNNTNSNKVLVRFLDIGVTKLVDRHDELREIDEKFFNCPLKALYCTICLDADLNRSQFKLTKEARKFFTRLIYKRVLFVKIASFNTIERKTMNQQTNICQVVLGCQTRRGIIDVCMYLLSKHDRKQYDLIRNREFEEQANTLIRSTSTSYLCLPTPSITANSKQKFQFDQVDSSLTNNNNDNNNNNIEHNDDYDLEDYIEEKANETVNLCDTELLDNIYEVDQTDSEINEYEHDVNEIMFADALNSCCIVNNLDNTIIYKTEDEDDEDNDDDENDYNDQDNSLDYLPVKDDDKNINTSNRSIKINSIHLPPPIAPPPPPPPLPTSQIPVDCKTPDFKLSTNNQRYTQSTLVAQRTKYMRPHDQYTTQMPFPPSNPLKSSQFNQLNNSSDTDSSLINNACCSAPLKLWNGNNFQRFKQKINKQQKSGNQYTPASSNGPRTIDEEIEEDLFTRLTNRSMMNNFSKKVKFQS